MDVGNTRIKWGVLERGEIRRTGHISQERIRDKGLQAITTRIPRRVDEVFVSNVAGATFATRLSGVVGMHCECDVRFARMIGAYAEVGSACVIVDVGTAMTIDAVDDEGQHLGGQIVAGVSTMANALATATSDIPQVKPAPGRERADLGMFAHNTAGAVREGAQNAVAGAIDRSIQTLQSNAYRPVVVLTGGDASRSLNALCESPMHRPHLVLQGLAHMLDAAR
jgi:type III pantothenate kinase